MIGTLLKKDWRLNRAPVIGSVIILVVSLCMNLLLLNQSSSQSSIYNSISSLLSNSMLVFVMAAIFGAMAFSVERRDGSAHFLAMLCPSRRMIMLSKLIVTLGCLFTFIILSVSISLLYLARAGFPGYMLNNYMFYNGLAMTFMSLIPFSVGWMLGIFMKSPSIAACIAMIGSWCVILFISGLSYWLYQSESLFPTVSFILDLTAAGCFFLIGTYRYYLRVEP